MDRKEKERKESYVLIFYHFGVYSHVWYVVVFVHPTVTGFYVFRGLRKKSPHSLHAPILALSRHRLTAELV